MVAAQTLPILPDLTVEQAEHWIAAMLAEARALRQHDTLLYPATDDPAAMLRAERLHAAWKRWAEDAALLHSQHVEPLIQAKHRVSGADDLDYAIGRTYAMLKLSPQAMVQRANQVRQGDVLTPEEVRGELRLAPRG